MKIIEAMKRVKANKEKVADLQNKIASNCSHLSYETPAYGQDQQDKINEWTQSCEDLSKENIRLLVAIQRTNMETDVTIKLGENRVTKKISEWVWRRREYAESDLKTYKQLTDRNLKEGFANSTTGVPVELKIVRYFNPERRDKKIAEYQAEPHEIDAALEVCNAVTDLIE